MLATELLLATLEDLVEDDFKKLKWYLSLKSSGNLKPIPKSYVEKASRTDTVSIMTKHHEEEPAVRLTVEILRKMNNNEAAGNLELVFRGKNIYTLHLHLLL
nr:NACHT, LRR and PYD domains-containing protein 4C-like [Labrus bergylta]